MHAQARTYVLWVASALETCSGCVGSNVVVAAEGGSDESAHILEDDMGSNARSMRKAAFEEDPFDVDMTTLEKAAR